MADKKKKPIIKKPLLKKEISVVPLPTLPVVASKSQGDVDATSVGDVAKGKDNLGMGTMPKAGSISALGRGNDKKTPNL